METDREVLSAVTRQVYASYLRRRHVFHPAWRTSPRWEQFWMKAADAIIRAGVDDPAGYVEAQFELMKPFPQPNHLHSQMAVRRYFDWRRERLRGGLLTEWEMQARSEVEYMKSRRAVYGARADRDEIADPSTPLSPLFRVLWGRRCGTAGAIPAELLAEWRGAAGRTALIKAAAEPYRALGLLDDAAARDLADGG